MRPDALVPPVDRRVVDARALLPVAVPRELVDRPLLFEPLDFERAELLLARELDRLRVPELPVRRALDPPGDF